MRRLLAAQEAAALELDLEAHVCTHGQAQLAQLEGVAHLNGSTVVAAAAQQQLPARLRSTTPDRKLALGFCAQNVLESSLSGMWSLISTSGSGQSG